MWENLRAVVISSIMTLIILASLIWAGIIPLQQQPNTYQLRQTIQETFTITGKNNQQTFTYPIKNLTGEAVARTLKVYAEFNVTNNPNQIIVNFEMLLFDSEKGVFREIRREASNTDKIFGSASIIYNLNVNHAYLLSIIVYGANVTGNLEGTIIQDITRT